MCNVGIATAADFPLPGVPDANNMSVHILLFTQHNAVRNDQIKPWVPVKIEMSIWCWS